MQQTAHGFKLIIFNIEKEVNVGLLFRSAYAFGCEEILLVGRQRFKATGASGTHRAQPSRRFFTLKEAVEDCKEKGYRIVGVEIGGTCLTRADLNRNIAFILGNEGRGLADAAKFCEEIVSVPQWGGVPSLNVTVAAAITMFEFQRRQDRPPLESRGQRYSDRAYPSPGRPT